MRHRAQKGFRGILVGIAQHQKGYLVDIPSTRNIYGLEIGGYESALLADLVASYIL